MTTLTGKTMITLHPNEFNVRMMNDHPELLTLAKTLGTPYVDAIFEQSRRQNLIYLASIQPTEE